MEINDLLTYLDIKAETADEFKKKFDEKYVRKDAAIDYEKLNAEIGKVKGSIETALKQKAKAFGVDFSSDEVKDKKIEELMELVFKKITENADLAIKTAKDEAKKARPQEIQELLDKLSKLNDKVRQYEEINAALKKDMELKEQEFSGKIKDIKRNLQVESLWNAIKFRSDIDQLQIKGFKAEVMENYRFDLNEKDELVITDKDGKYIPSMSKHGAIKSPHEVITELAMKHKILSTNKDEGRRAFVPANGADSGQPHAERRNPIAQRAVDSVK
jgi:hypothetical protein